MKSNSLSWCRKSHQGIHIPARNKGALFRVPGLSGQKPVPECPGTQSYGIYPEPIATILDTEFLSTLYYRYFGPLGSGFDTVLLLSTANLFPAKTEEKGILQDNPRWGHVFPSGN